MRDITEIVIHHSLTPSSQTLEKSIASFDKTHKERLHPEENSLGYHIAYHYVIGGDGSVELTRRYNEIGYHASNWEVNKRSIGICLVGNFDAEQPSEEQLDSLREVCQLIQGDFNITKITPHREYSNKSCPGLNISDEFIQSLFYNPITMFDNTPMFNLIKSLPEFNQTKGNCVPTNIALCGAMLTKRNYPFLNLKIDETFSKRVRKLLGRREDSTVGVLVESIKMALEEDRDSYIDYDAGDCIMRFYYDSIVPLEERADAYESRLRRGIPVLADMTYFKGSNTHMKYYAEADGDEWPSKHECTILGLAKNDDYLFYDTSSTKQDVEGIPHVKRIDRQLVLTAGNLRNQGLYKAWDIKPDVILKD